MKQYLADIAAVRVCVERHLCQGTNLQARDLGAQIGTLIKTHFDGLAFDAHDTTPFLCCTNMCHVAFHRWNSLHDLRAFIL